MCRLLRLAKYKISARSTFVKGSLVLNIFYTAVRILHPSRETAHDRPTNIHSPDLLIFKGPQFPKIRLKNEAVLFIVLALKTNET